MSRTVRAVAVLLIQAVLVLSIAAKYLYERKNSPRVWARAGQYDPSLPLRGRYFGLQLAVDACSLPHDKAHHIEGYSAPGQPPNPGHWQWTVRLLAQKGTLVPVLAKDTDRPELTEELTQWSNDSSCDRAMLSDNMELFVSDQAKSPFPLAKDEELWVEVTLPPMGPPRPIQLAIRKGDGRIPFNQHDTPE